MTVVNRSQVDRHAATMKGSAPPSISQPSIRARRRATTMNPATAIAEPCRAYRHSSTVASERFTPGGACAR
jgi:hypothetical protein